jgi:phosphonatase-like hydrolase
MAKFDLIVFDMAGTTVRDLNEVENCFLEAAQQTGLEAPSERIIGMMGWSKKLVFETLWNEQLPSAPQYEVESMIDSSYLIFKSILENHYRTQEVRTVENCKEVFEQVRNKGVKIALTTGFYREVTNIILNRLGWDDGLNEQFVQTGPGPIDCSISSDEVAFGRPAPYMIFKAMEKTQIFDTRKVINIGDTPSDLQSGHNARVGLNLGVSYGTHSYEQLSQLPHNHIISDISTVLDFI